MIYWAQLFHFYQPSFQIPLVLEKVCAESYKPLLETFRAYPHARATVNINGVLLEMLRDYGQGEVIEGLRELAEKGQIEFSGSGKYHPILPLLPADERARQIELNIRAGRSFFGKSFAPRGFFPPEMAYSSEVLPEVLASGHKWLILSGVACPAAWPVDQVYQAQHGGQKIAVFYRDDILSNKISFHQIGAREFLDHLNTIYVRANGGDTYLVTAMDAETYGHHIKDWEKLFLAAVYEQLRPTHDTYAGIKQATVLAAQESALLSDTGIARRVTTVTLSDLMEIIKPGSVVAPRSSSWSTSNDDLTASNYYPLWRDEGNEVHRLQWEHLHICLDLVKQAGKCATSEECRFFAGIARGLLDQAENSDQFWWASRRPMWDINIIHVGLLQQQRVIVNAFRSINKSEASGEVKRESYYRLLASRDIRNKIVDRLFAL